MVKWKIRTKTEVFYDVMILPSPIPQKNGFPPQGEQFFYFFKHSKIQQTGSCYRWGIVMRIKILRFAINPINEINCFSPSLVSLFLTRQWEIKKSTPQFLLISYHLQKYSKTIFWEAPSRIVSKFRFKY